MEDVVLNAVLLYEWNECLDVSLENVATQRDKTQLNCLFVAGVFVLPSFGFIRLSRLTHSRRELLTIVIGFY